MISQLRERVSRDPLTGLHASLPPLPERTAVVMLDVDGLGAVNGVRGQAAGDDVLRAAAGLLRELMPPGSQAFRVGADEFVVTIDPARASAAEHVGWELRSQAPSRLGPHRVRGRRRGVPARRRGRGLRAGGARRGQEGRAQRRADRAVGARSCVGACPELHSTEEGEVTAASRRQRRCRTRPLVGCRRYGRGQDTPIRSDPTGAIGRPAPTTDCPRALDLHAATEPRP